MHVNKYIKCKVLQTGIPEKKLKKKLVKQQLDRAGDE